MERTYDIFISLFSAHFHKLSKMACENYYSLYENSITLYINTCLVSAYVVKLFLV
jgi:hypothetical protein